MSPPERTFGPIGWKGLFGDDEGSDDETSPNAEGSADPEGRGTADGTVSTRSQRREASVDQASSGAERSTPGTGEEGISRTETQAAIRDERSRRASELSEGGASDATDAEGDPLDEWQTLDELSEGEEPGDTDEPPDGTGRRTATDQRTLADEAESEPAPTGGVTDGRSADLTPTDGPTDAAGSATTPDETSGSGRSTDSGSSGIGAAGGSTAAGATGRDATESAEGTRRGSSPEIANAESPPREPRVRTEQSDAVPTASARRDTSAHRESADAASPPPEARVRTERSDTEPEPESSTSEKTFGPIGLTWLSDDEDESDEVAARTEETRSRSDETGIARTEESGRSTGTVDLDRHRRPAGDETATEEEGGLTDRVPWSVSLTAIGVGVGLLVFLDIVSMMVPLIAAIGAGIVGGFVAGYIAGGTIRGAAHALVVGIIGGIAVGYLTALIGALIGLFLEPATLLGSQVGPIAPDLGMFGSWGPLMVMVFVTAMVAIDATIGGVVGGTLRSMVDEVR